MARHKVFICYSHKDQELFDQFLIHLDPYGRQDLLEVWTDRQIMAGEEWEPKIFRSIARADAAVVLVSPDLLASDFVREQELPRLLQAREEGRLTLAPLFLRHAGTKFLRFRVETADGDREIDLTQIQGLNLPAEPLALLEPAARDKALADAAETLYEVLSELPAPEARPARPRRELTVALELRQGQLARRYGQPPYYDLHQSRGPIDLKRLETLARRSPDDLGRQLFGLLMGPEQERDAVLGRAYGRRVSDPLRHAFRVRVRTDDPDLRALPWALCGWRRHRLVDEGWTFELAASDDPRPVEHLRTPCRALLLAANSPGRPELLADAHARSYESLLARAWDHPLKARLMHRARNVAELEAELTRPVELLYVYAHAVVDKGRLALRLADDAALPLERLAELLEKRPPRVAVLNTVGACPLAPPLPRVAATVHLRHEDDGDRQHPARFAAATWWEAVLGNGVDPVRAFCALPEKVRARGAIFTDYQEWKVDHSDYVPKVDRPRAHLDRRDQRRAALDAIDDLVRGRRRKVTCVVAYGADGNLVDYFGVQVMATMKERGRDLARLQRVRLRLPADISHAAVVEHFRDSLGLQPGDALGAGLRHRRGGPRAKPVYFLDWGTYGEGHGSPLVSGDLETWALFCRDDLEAACPPGARVLAYLSLVSEEDRHAGLVKVVRALKKEHYRPHFDLIALPALGTVTAEDLLRFLAEPGNSSCPPAFLDDLPERIVRETQGGFEATVELLEATERGNRWFELAEELEEAGPRPELDKDIPL